MTECSLVGGVAPNSQFMRFARHTQGKKFYSQTRSRILKAGKKLCPDSMASRLRSRNDLKR